MNNNWVIACVLMVFGLPFFTNCTSQKNKEDSHSGAAPIPEKTENTAQFTSNKMNKEDFDFSMYPEAKAGEKRHIIFLPPKENPSNYKVEFFVGKDMEIDCNAHSFTGNFERKDIQGWGYLYYEFKDGNVISTMMGCPDDSKKRAFVRSQGIMENYNSRMPIVVYTDKDMEVRYKIWQVGEEEYIAH